MDDLYEEISLLNKHYNKIHCSECQLHKHESTQHSVNLGSNHGNAKL